MLYKRLLHISHFDPMRCIWFCIVGSWNISHFDSVRYLSYAMPSELTFNLPIMFNIWCVLYLQTPEDLTRKTYLICHSCEIYWPWNFQKHTYLVKLRRVFVFLSQRSIFSMNVGLSCGLDQAEILAWKKKILLAGGFEDYKWHSYLDVEAHTKRVVVAVVGRMPSEVEAGQQRLWIPSIGVVDPATPHMSWIFHELMEA